MAGLRRRLDLALEGTGGVTFLLGDTGVGKTTLLAGWLRDLRDRGIRVMVGRAPAMDSPPPYSLLHSAIESARDDPTLRSDENPPIAGNLFLIGFAPTFSDVAFPTPVGIEQRLLEVLGASAGSGKVSTDRVVTGIAERFLEFTRHGPTVLILDDLDRADRSSLAAIEFFARELSTRPLWILATSVPFESLSESGRTRLEAFESATGAERIALPPMTVAETAEFLRLTSPSAEFSGEELERRFSESGGNPLFLLQLDRRRSSEGEGRDRPARPLPALDTSPEEALEIAAVLGRQFTFDLLQRVSGVAEERLAEGIERLILEGLIVERPGEILEFPVDRLREAAYSRLPEIGRRLLHRSAGEALEEMPDPPPERIFELARHFYLGRESRKSVRYNRIAAAAADRALAPDVAADHLAHALESSRDLPESDRASEWELVLELGGLLFDLGRLEAAERVLKEILAPGSDVLGLSPPVRATLEVCLAQTLIARGDVTDAQALAEKVLRTDGLDDQLLVRIGAHHQLGQTLYYQGHYPQALSHHSEEMRLARAAGNERVSAHAELWHAGVLAMMGQPEEAIAEAREVAIALDRLGSVRESGQGHLFLGNMLADTKTAGYCEEALSELEKAAQLGDQAKDPRRVGWSYYHAAELLRHFGRFEEASEKVQRACGILGPIGDRTGLCMSLKVRGQIAMAQGAHDASERDLLEALRVIEGRNQAMIEVDVVLRLAQLAIARGDLPGARLRLGELERQQLPSLRADLVPEFAALQRDLR